VSVLGVVELRQYTLHPGQRETLINLFERAFIEPQEAAGIRVLGQFRDLENPDRFVWLRGFPDLHSRPAALGTFYGGPVWAQHREAANATMIDSDDVLLLRPIPGAPALPEDGAVPPQPGSSIITTIYRLQEEPSAECIELFAATGASAVALLQSEPAPNNFPGLPVREGEHVLVRIDRVRDGGASQPEASSAEPDVTPFLADRMRVLHLEPTDRSLLR
jgi:hypothetical protein